MVDSEKVDRAFWRFVNNKNTRRDQQYIVTARVYAAAKIRYSEILSKLRTGTRHSEEFKKAKSRQMMGKNNPMFNKTHSESALKKIKEARARQDNSHLKNRVISQEWRDKISKTLLEGSSTKGIPKPKYTCAGCGGLFAGHIIARFHGNKCKAINN